MNKKLNNLYKILITSFGTLSAVTVLGKTIAFENRALLNKQMGLSTTKYVEDESAQKVDTDYFKSKYKTLDEEMAASRAVSQEAEEEGAVLLKNDNDALPLASGAKVSFFGVASVDPVYSGTGSGATNTADADTFKSAFEGAGKMEVNPTLWDWYSKNKSTYTRKSIIDPNKTWAGATGLDINGAPWSEVKENNGSTFATYGDCAFVVIARVGGEGTDLPCSKSSPVTLSNSETGDYLELSTNEKALLAGLKSEKDAGTIKKIVVLLNSANAIETPFIDDGAYGIDAALWIGSTGHKGLSGVARIINGEVSPSGGLSDTYFTNNNLYNPVMKNFGNFTYTGDVINSLYGQKKYQLANSLGKYVVYQEGVYLGYKYAETRYEDTILSREKTGSFCYSDVIDYPFGYGLTYADFDLSDYKVVEDSKLDTYTISVKVTNKSTSKHSGKKNVQFYIQKPYTDYDIANGIEKPSVELVGFAKTKTLNPGESETVSYTVSGRDFASYDSAKAKTYVLDSGDYYLTAASNSHEAINNILAEKGATTDNSIFGKGSKDLVYMKTCEFSDTKYRFTESEKEGEGTKIENQFDHGDPNKTLGEENKVTFMSRNNWEGTYPTGDLKLTLTQEMYDTMIDMMTIKADDSVSYPTYSAGNSIQLIDLKGKEYDNEQWDNLLDNLSWDETIKLVTQGFRSTTAISSVGKKGTIDSNGPCGLTDAYGNGPNGLAAKNNSDPDKKKYPTTFPCNGIIAATFSSELSTKVGEAIGEDALWAGYSGLYGPCSNIHRSPYEGRAFEYYSEDSVLSGLILADEVAAITEKGCYVYNKHFALNDQETNRAGVCTWANEQTIRETYLKAFALPIKKTPFQCVMTSMNRIGLVPTVMDNNLNTNFLRGELGMEGINVTDYWGSYSMYSTMEACLMNGVNLPDGNISDDGLKVFENYKPGTGYGQLAQNMRESAHRILYMVGNSNAMNGIAPGGKIIDVTQGWEIALISAQWVFIGLTALAAVGLVLNLLNVFPKVTD